MSTPGDGELEDRVRVLEREVARLRERLGVTGHDAEAARVLAAGADRDVSEVRAELHAHTQALNALRATQLEQGDRIDGLRTEVDGLRGEMRDGFATMNVGMTRIAELLHTAPGHEEN